MAEIAFDTSTADFQRDVLEASKSVPIVVDFWAPWCAPCRALKPVLEKLASEYRGQFKLARLNTDAHPEIATQYGVRGIPDVKAFVDGKLASEFTGALPESAVRKFIEALLPSPAQTLVHAAREDVRAGGFDAAEAKLREAIHLDAHLAPAWVALAELLLARQDIDGAAAAIGSVPAQARDDGARQLAAKIEFAQKGKSLPDLASLRQAVTANPGDLDARLALGERLVADGDYAAALDAFLAVIRADRDARRERARKAMIEVFGLAASDPERVSDYRRRLAAELH